MTLNTFFNGLTQNFLFGGIAAALLIFVMFRKANEVAATGSKAKMAWWSLAPSLMVIVAVLAHGVALGIVWPRLQAAFTSAPAQNTLALADQLTAMADQLLWVNGGEMGAQFVGPAAFTADAQPSTTGGAVSFTSQPAPAPAAKAPVQVTTNEQAVAAVNALAAKDSAQTYINTFIADNTPTDATVACGGSYTIKSGDSLAKIAKACYGDSNRWRDICNANRLADCNNVRAGVVLVIPGDKPNMAPVQNQIPESFGHQPAYQAQPTPVFAQQPAQQAAAAPVRNVASGEVVITTNADAVAAVQALAPAPVAQPTARPAYVLNEVLGKPSNDTGLEYINKFLAENNNNGQVAQADQ